MPKDHYHKRPSTLWCVPLRCFDELLTLNCRNCKMLLQLSLCLTVRHLNMPGVEYPKTAQLCLYILYMYSISPSIFPFHFVHRHFKTGLQSSVISLYGENKLGFLPLETNCSTLHYAVFDLSSVYMLM